MKLTSRSYPYPVVGNRDDVPGAAFQANVEMTTDKQAIYLDAAINCSSKTVNQLVKDGTACFVVHVECSNTLFRRAYDFAGTNHRIAIPADNLNDAVEVNVFARTRQDIPGYRVEKAHSDYGDVTFEVGKGDIIAVGEGQVFYIPSSFDSLSRIGSLMQVIPSSKDGDLPMSFDTNNEKILIVLSKKDFAEYNLLKSMEGVSVALSTAIVLPVLTEALDILKSEPDYDRRWARALHRRLDSLGLSLEKEPLEIAQLMLELPVKRTFASARMYAEGAS